MHSFLLAISPHILYPTGSPNSPCVSALAGRADLPVEVLLELQAGIRCVPLQRDKQTNTQMARHPAKLQSCHLSWTLWSDLLPSLPS